jgi:signal transduction histidine kinase
MDSIGVSVPKNIQTIDVKKAMQGQKGKWVGEVEYDNHDVMAISYPLKSNDKIVGVIRFIASLQDTNKAIFKISMLLILVGIMVIFISGLVSVVLSNTIVRPLKSVTSAAEKMASGDFNAKSIKTYDDEIGKLSDTLNYMAEEIIKKDELKNEFISSISHELRTPLTSIKGWAVTLNSDNLDDKELIRSGLDIIEKESDRLTSMVEELLDFSKFVSGKISLSKTDVDIEKVMVYIANQLSPRAKVENITFTLKCEDDLPHIFGDENRIKQVLINLLDNAFKFTSENGKIAFSAMEKDGFIIICVEDNGSGIPSEDLPYVKDKFYKGKSSKSKNGLGLSISDEIVKLHNGKIEIESEVGVGTKVCVWLPCDKEGGSVL